jgi:hypothetical protein
MSNSISPEGSPKQESILRMGAIYRYAVGVGPSEYLKDGLVNFFFVTASPNRARVQLDKGIAPIGRVANSPLIQDRTPAILISSTIHNKGSELNPWQDQLVPDHGYARYFGDAKTPGNPSLAPGNKLLLSEYEKHLSGDPKIRAQATPLLIFEGVKVDGRIKGNKKFAGLAVIEKAELVTQYNPKIGYFTNYVFQFAILSLTAEDEVLDWSWINDRRNGELPLEATLENAPKSWLRWIKLGNERIELVRRQVSTLRVENPDKQKPKLGSPEDKALKDIYNFYSNHSSKHRFELLASKVVMDFVNSYGGNYRYGWITRGSGDGGVDFVGKVEIGSGFSAVQVLVLGQAKCEDPKKPTNGKDLARTVARLKRGWIGAYVTTSFFSPLSQKEIIEDEYPLIKINGLVLAEHALRLKDAAGKSTMKEYLLSIDEEYPEVIQQRRPEDILWV